MCLTIAGTKRPAEPQIYYKIVKKTARTSPYYPTPYDVGHTVKAEGEISVLNQCGEPTDSFAVYNKIYGGVIHVYTDKHFAERDATFLNTSYAPGNGDVYCVARVKCYPEYFVAIGDFCDAAYTQVEVLD